MGKHKELIFTRKISAEAYQNWLSKTALLKAEGAKLWVRVPDAVTRDWILQEYSAEIWSAVRELNLSLREIVYEEHGSVDNGSAQEKSDIVFSPSINLNPKFTFESFVVGSCNQFAHAAAQSVARILREPTTRSSSTAEWEWGKRI